MSLEPLTPRDLRNARKQNGLTQGEVVQRANEIARAEDNDTDQVISQPGLSQAESGNNDVRLSTVNYIILAINSLE